LGDDFVDVVFSVEKVFELYMAGWYPVGWGMLPVEVACPEVWW